MPTATNNHTTSRRSALGLSAAAIVAGITAPTMARASVPGPDAELIALCDQFLSIQTEWFLLQDHDGWATDFGPNHARYEHLDNEQDRLLALIDKGQSPTTPAGCAAMARVALTLAILDTEGNFNCDSTFEELLVMVAQGMAPGFVWPPRPGSCSTAHWAPQMSPAEVAECQAAEAAATEVRAQAYRAARERERIARRAEKGIGSVPAGKQEMLGMDVDGSLYVWSTENIQPITGFDDLGPHISSGHYLIWWRGHAVAAHLSSRMDYMIDVQFMCNSGPTVAMERQEVEDIVVGKMIKDPEHHARMMASFDQIEKTLHLRQTSARKLRGKVLA